MRRHEITAQDIAWAEGIARSYGIQTGTERLVDEWISAALWGLVQTWRSWDETGGARFWTKATTRVRGAILDAARAELPYGFRNPNFRDGAPSVVNLSLASDEKWSALGGTILDPAPYVGFELDAIEALERFGSLHERRETFEFA